MTKQAELAHLFRALKAPAAAHALQCSPSGPRGGLDYERFAEICSAQRSQLATATAAKPHQDRPLPARKTLEEFDFTFQRSSRRP